MKRIAIKLVVFLLLGAVVNVAVAWGCAIRPYEGGSYLWTSPRGYDAVVSRRSGEFGATQIPGGARVNYGRLTPPQWIDEHQYHALVPRWSAFKNDEPRLGSLMFSEDAAGWPALSLRYFEELTLDGATKVRGLIELPWLESPWRSRAPRSPIFPGFAINTLFYAALLVATLRAVRHPPSHPQATRPVRSMRLRPHGRRA